MCQFILNIYLISKSLLITLAYTAIVPVFLIILHVPLEEVLLSEVNEGFIVVVTVLAVPVSER